MTKEPNWTFDGQLEATALIPSIDDEERAKIAALLGKAPEATPQADSIAYSVVFEQPKKSKPRNIRGHVRTSPVPQPSSVAELTAQYKPI